MGIRTGFLTAFSGKDNTSIDIGRVLWAGSFVLFCVLEAHSVFFLHVAFDQMGFAQASGIILAAGGVALGAKAHCEPDRHDGGQQ